MTEFEAYAQGFIFTGCCWDSCDKGKEDTAKKRAAEIKKMFEGADYRVVSGTANGWLSRGYKGIWGNEIFNKVRYYDLENTLKNKLAMNDRKRQQLLEELAKLDQDDEDARALDAEINSLLKISKKTVYKSN